MNTSYIKAAVAAFIIFLVGDTLWHGFIFGDFYMSRLDAINGAPTPENPAFIMVFEVLAALISTRFVLRTSRTSVAAMQNGALLGLLASSAINFVNHTLIIRWDAAVTGLDTLWGIIIGAISGAVIFAVAGRRA